MAKKGGSQSLVDAALDKAIAEEIERVTKKKADGEYVHSITERMKVYDRALKLEALKQKGHNPGFGGNFK